jgi:hypothetical protein
MSQKNDSRRIINMAMIAIMMVATVHASETVSVPHLFVYARNRLCHQARSLCIGSIGCSNNAS